MSISSPLRMSAAVEELIAAQFGRQSSDQNQSNQSIYLNSGCCGRKPLAVLEAISRAHLRVNNNPCHLSFNDRSPAEQCRRAVSTLLGVESKDIFLALSTTNALQIFMQSFLLERGDEFVTTGQEHGSVRTIARYLSESRGVVVKSAPVDGGASPECNESKSASQALCQRLIDLVTPQTRLVAVSEIISYTGFRPDYSTLALHLRELGIPLLADCAHGPGQFVCHPELFPLWVGSGHKWLGGPNGTAFAYVRPDLAPKLLPLSLSDTYYDNFIQNQSGDLSRLEGTGTSDSSRLVGLTAAIDLHLSVQKQAIPYQISLASYLRAELAKNFAPHFRLKNVPDCTGLSLEQLPQESTSIVNFRFEQERLRVANLQDYLWDEHNIAVQLDYLSDVPGLGMRVSCHVSNTLGDIDALLAALEKVVIK